LVNEPVLAVHVVVTKTEAVTHDWQIVLVVDDCPQAVHPTTAVPPAAVKQAVQIPAAGVG